ncbi:MAG: VOC family protein [Deltaproteobacteria bacterium]|nr:VOC family protein [Myxococcales bacterium]TDJ13600.1 MAG: VOC family protein [Deltaproteobacteria bacterium]
MTDVGFTHVALPVTDLDASIAFYSHYAGMKVVHHRPEVVWLSDGRRPFVLVLIESKRVKHPLRPFSHLGVACRTRDDVDRLCEQARAEDILVAGPTDDGPPVGYWAFFRDPDGHTLEISHGQEVALTVDEATDG